MDKNEPTYEDGSSMRPAPQSQREADLMRDVEHEAASRWFRVGFISGVFLSFVPWFILGAILA